MCHADMLEAGMQLQAGTAESCKHAVLPILLKGSWPPISLHYESVSTNVLCHTYLAPQVDCVKSACTPFHLSMPAQCTRLHARVTKGPSIPA